VYYDNKLYILGMSQNPYTKDYVIVFSNNYFANYCLTCDKRQYSEYYYKWCKPCQIDYLKTNFINWTSGNEKIDNLIQEMQLKINFYHDLIVKWTSYDEFDSIEEIAKHDFATIYSAKWKDYPLIEYVVNTMKYNKNLNKNIILKCLYNIQNVDEFINEV
jgi:hypothetical protein